MYVREKLELGIIEDLILIISKNSVLANDIMINNEINSQLTLILSKQSKIISNISDSDFKSVAKSFFELDNEFHKCIFSSLNKADLWDFLMSLLPDYVRFRTMMTEFYTIDDLQNLLNEHRQILEYLTLKDINSLRKIYRNHINGGMALFTRIIEEKEDYFFI